MNINIEQVANGFVVREPPLGDGYASFAIPYVFQTLAALFEHIRSIQTLEVVPLVSYANKDKVDDITGLTPQQFGDLIKTAVDLSKTSPAITYGHPEN